VVQISNGAHHLLADALSTTFTVLGPKDAIVLAEKIPGVETLIIIPWPKFYQTKGFPQF